MSERLTFDELMNAPIRRTIINEPIDYSVEETAEQRARRRWRMEEAGDESRNPGRQQAWDVDV
jgi:hypothetical protein